MYLICIDWTHLQDIRWNWSSLTYLWKAGPSNAESTPRILSRTSVYLRSDACTATSNLPTSRPTFVATAVSKRAAKSASITIPWSANWPVMVKLARKPWKPVSKPSILTSFEVGPSRNCQYKKKFIFCIQQLFFDLKSVFLLIYSR